MSTRDSLKVRVEQLISSCEAGEHVDVVARDILIEDLAAWQATQIPEYARLQRHGEWPPALPADVFRFRRIARHDAQSDRRVFRSSGTTSPDRSVHPMCDLDLYDSAARVAARRMLFPDVERIRIVTLAPHEDDAPDSSLSYMLVRFAQWFGSKHACAWRNDALDLELLTVELESAQTAKEPIAVLGTSFAFVHAEDGLGNERFRLPPRSRIMQTGGYKGYTREVEPSALRQAMSTRYGVEDPYIVAEYGMTELSSQMYETTLRDHIGATQAPRRLWVPPWVRATPVDPDTLEPVEGDSLGVLRIDDCANLDSVCCVQTADLARRLDDGIVVAGRVAGATPRGCSLAVDQALGVR